MYYKGKVNIKLKDKDTIIEELNVHNSGTRALQKALLNCLLGYHDANAMPMYLATGYNDSDNTYFKDNIVFTARHLEEDSVTNDYKAVFTATILSSDVPSGTTTMTVYMLDATKENQLASVTITNISLSALTQNRELVFTWEMTLPLATSNTQESESE